MFAIYEIWRGGSDLGTKRSFTPTIHFKECEGK